MTGVLIITGEESPAGYRTWYRLAVGVWIMVALLWFGGVFSAIRKLLKYDEISEPFRFNDDDQQQLDEDPNQVSTGLLIKPHRICIAYTMRPIASDVHGL